MFLLFCDFFHPFFLTYSTVFIFNFFLLSPRLSTDLYGNIKTVPRISVIPTSPILENNGETGNDGKSLLSNPLKTESEFHRFCRTLSMIEIERNKQIEKLKVSALLLLI